MCGADPLSCLYGLLTGRTPSGDYTAAIAAAGVSTTSGSYSGGRWAGTVLLGGLGAAAAEDATVVNAAGKAYPGALDPRTGGPIRRRLQG
jgi:hypothetical protein